MKARVRGTFLFAAMLLVFAVAAVMLSSGTAEAAGGKWLKDETGYYYQYSNGKHAVNKWEQIGSKWYHFDKKGYMQTGWQRISKKWYYFKASGEMQVGWKTIGGAKYYFKEGVMVTGEMYLGNKLYVFADSGKLKKATTVKAKLKVPDTSKWTKAKTIYAYSWDDDFKKKLDIVLNKYPKLKPYVKYVNLGVASEQSIEIIDAAFASNKYPSLIPADIGSAKYWIDDDSKTLDLKTIGFTDAMMQNSYDYAKEFGTYKGKLKAVTWQSTAGSVFYNRAIAKKVFGTDDPKEIQEQLKDWDSFFRAAAKLKAKGYKIVSGPKDIYYAIINTHSKPWVQTNSKGQEVFKTDDTMKTYITYAKKLVSKGYTNKSNMWDEKWADNMKDGGNVFCYFGCPWMIGVFQGYGATDGSWATCAGPSSFYWGGTYVSVGKKTPNPELCAFILYELTCDPAIGVQITNKCGDVVNNKEANRQLAAGKLKKNYAARKFFGGQNPIAVWSQVNEGITQKAVTFQDKNYEGFISTAAQKYVSGKFSTVAKALSFIKTKSKKELGIP